MRAAHRKFLPVNITGVYDALLKLCNPFGTSILDVWRTGNAIPHEVPAESRLERHWAPPLGAVLGCAPALVGELLF